VRAGGIRRPGAQRRRHGRGARGTGPLQLWPGRPLQHERQLWRLNISESGTEEQKRRLLPGCWWQGETLFAYGLSEPDVGGDLGNVKTRAERKGDRVIINGAKRWTSGAAMADYIYALVRSGPPEARRKNLSFVLIPTNAKGVDDHQDERHGFDTACPTNDVTFVECRDSVREHHRGEAGWNNGWSILAGPALEVEKLAPTAIASAGRSRVAEAWAYSQQRVQGGKHICGHQAVRHVLSEVQTKMQACRLMMRHAAWLVETNQPSAVATRMAKLFIAETARRSCSTASSTSWAPTAMRTASTWSARARLSLGRRSTAARRHPAQQHRQPDEAAARLTDSTWQKLRQSRCTLTAALPSSA
jgi:alkylation response protein AidB-like acyl-CoA dehydrogenase